MNIIPLQAVPNQTVYITLNGQATQLNIYQTAVGMFMDVLVSGVQIIAGVICENLNRIVRDLYLGFQGDFMFLDNQGSTDPYYTGLGTQYSLVYLSPSDLPAGVG